MNVLYKLTTLPKSNPSHPLIREKRPFSHPRSSLLLLHPPVFVVSVRLRALYLLLPSSELGVRMTREHLLECLVDDFGVGEAGRTVDSVMATSVAVDIGPGVFGTAATAYPGHDVTLWSGRFWGCCRCSICCLDTW